MTRFEVWTRAFMEMKQCIHNRVVIDALETKSGWVAGIVKRLALTKGLAHCKRLLESSGGVVVRALASHQCGPGSIIRLGVTFGLSLLALHSPLRGFFPGTLIFPFPQKPTFDKIWFVLWGAGMAVVRALASHQCGPGSIPRSGVKCGLSMASLL